MQKKMRNVRKQDGFTLVEMIVSMAVLAILAAVLIPSLTGYIDKARQQQIIAETRSVVMAAQVIVSEDYAVDSSVAGNDAYATDDIKAEILALAEAGGTIDSLEIQGTSDTSAEEPAGKVISLTYTSNNVTCHYSIDGEGTDLYTIVE